jgi:hypothetical protein
MDPLIIGAVALLLVTVIAAAVIFRPRGDFTPPASQDVAAPLSSEDRPVMMKYQGGANQGDSDAPLQDVIQMRDEDGPPLPSKFKSQPSEPQSGLMDRAKPPAPAPGNGPLVRSFNPGAVKGGDGAAAPMPGEGQKDVLFGKPPTQNPGQNREQ